MGNKKYTPEEIDIIKKEYPLCSKEVIMSLLPGRDYGTIKWKANDLGVYKERAVQIESDVSKLLDESNETYYWIGFLMADGYISHDTNRISLALQVGDVEHVRKFANYIKREKINFSSCNSVSPSTGKLYVKKSYIVSAMDKFYIPQIIEKYDFKPRKTYNPPNLSYLNKDFNQFASFLIGFIDGDGSIVKNKNRLKKETKLCSIKIGCHLSWEKNLQFFSDKLRNFLKCDRIKSTISKKDGCSYIVFSTKCINFLKLKTIELKLPILNRKWDKVNENYITRDEQIDINKGKIVNLLNGEYTINEIANKIGYSYSGTRIAVKKIMKDNVVLKIKKGLHRTQTETYKSKYPKLNVSSLNTERNKTYL